MLKIHTLCIRTRVITKLKNCKGGVQKVFSLTRIILPSFLVKNKKNILARVWIRHVSGSCLLVSLVSGSCLLVSGSCLLVSARVWLVSHVSGSCRSDTDWTRSVSCFRLDRLWPAGQWVLTDNYTLQKTRTYKITSHHNQAWTRDCVSAERWTREQVLIVLLLCCA